jgi:hypothetical protein
MTNESVINSTKIHNRTRVSRTCYSTFLPARVVFEDLPHPYVGFIKNTLDFFFAIFQESFKTFKQT